MTADDTPDGDDPADGGLPVDGGGPVDRGAPGHDGAWGAPGGHLGDLVADLTEGRLAGADPALVLQHVQRCPACRTGLADAVVAGAALRELAGSTDPRDPLAIAEPAPTPPCPPLPPLPVPAPEVGGRGSPGRDARGAVLHRAGRRRVGAVVGGVLVALVVGAAGGVGALEAFRAGTAPGAATPVVAPSSPAPLSPAPSSTPPVSTPPEPVSPEPAPAAGTVRAVLAGSTGGRPTVGEVVIGGTGTMRRMALWTTGLRVPVAGEVYEVWLDGSTPLAVGALDPAGSGSWVMASSVAAGHSTVLVVRQRVGALTPRGGDVVARASFS